jgi:branched-chain amino acid transport system substrate-binding protein
LNPDEHRISASMAVRRRLHSQEEQMLFRLSSIVLAVTATAVLAGPALAQETIKIGVTEPLTGAFAASGNYVTQGARIAEDEINKAGGVLGKKIQLVVEDNKSNPTEAVATAEKLINSDKVPVMMGAWSSTLTLAVMPKLEEYKIPMLVETSSSDKITTSGNPYIFRISPTSGMEARAFTPLVKKLGIKKADFLATNNDFGLGASKAFSEMAKNAGVQIGVVETMDPKATDFSAQLAKIKASGGDTLFVTTAVEQITLILKQANDLQLKTRIITTGGSNAPDQLIEQAGAAANGSMHLVFFTPWFPDAVKNPEIAKKFVSIWNDKKYNVGGLTEGFRGWDGIYTIVAGIKAAGSADPAAITKALWNVKVKGINGDIAFIKQGPAGKESAQNVPSVYLVKIEGGKVVKD